MIKSWFSKKLMLPTQDFVTGTKIVREHKLLMNSDYFTRHQLHSIQIKKLKQLINYAHQHFLFYKELFDIANLKPSDIKSLDDITKIPIVDKQIARDAGEKLYCSHLDKSSYKYGKTGGTTGIPLFYKKNIHTRSVGWGAYYRWYKWLNLVPGDSRVSLWGAPTVLTNKLSKRLYDNVRNFFNNSLVINSFNMNDETLKLVVPLIEKKKPKIIHGYLSAILQLSYYLEKNKIDSIRPEVILPTTETLLLPYRKHLEKTFNAKVYDQYGCGECGSIGFECTEQNGLHVAMEHCIVEVINKDSNGVGDVVVTDLDNFAMPFIRYKNGDRAKVVSERCKCGRSSDRLVSIAGRNIDTIVLKDGSKVHGVFFTDIMGELNFFENKKIQRFQAFQINSGDLVFKVEGIKLSKANHEKLHLILQRFFNKVEIKYYDFIPSDSSGKFRYVISEI